MNVKRPNENGQKSLYQSRNCFIINTPVVGLQNLNQSTNYTRGCIELTSKFSFLLCKLGKAVFICAPENVLAVSMLDHLDVCEEVNNITEPPLVQFMTGKVFRQDVFETLAFFLNAAHCIIDRSSSLPRPSGKLFPASCCGTAFPSRRRVCALRHRRRRTYCVLRQIIS